MLLPNEIIDFYLVRAPYAHSDKPSSVQSLDLSTLQWEKRKLGTLMEWIVFQHISADGESRIHFSISNDVHRTSDRLFAVQSPSTLNENGGIFCIKKNLRANEDNSISCKLTETYATCFFRHIRNSIAHGNYEYDQGTGLIMFRDQASDIGTKDPAFTAVFQTDISFLNQLMKIVTAGPSQLGGEKLSRVPSYRVERKITADIEDTGE